MHTLHGKSSYQLELTKVRGIGEKKAQKLLVQYKTMENMKKATVEELAKAAGVNLEIAKELYTVLQKI
jgi:excinuclease ABC subunit C